MGSTNWPKLEGRGKDAELGGNGSGGRPGKSCGRGAKSNQNSSHKIPKEPTGDIRKKKKKRII